MRQLWADSSGCYTPDNAGLGRHDHAEARCISVQTAAKLLSSLQPVGRATRTSVRMLTRASDARSSGRKAATSGGFGARSRPVATTIGCDVPCKGCNAPYSGFAGPRKGCNVPRIGWDGLHIGCNVPCIGAGMRCALVAMCRASVGMCCALVAMRRASAALVPLWRRRAGLGQPLTRTGIGSG